MSLRHVLVLGLLLGAAQPARAQVIDPSIRFNLNRFKPAPAPLNYIMTEGGRTLGHLNFSGTLYLDYAFQPLVLDTVEVIEHQLNMNLMVALGLWNHLELALALPVNLWQEGDDPGTRPKGNVGDLRILIKVRAVTAGPFTLAFGLPIEAPTGSTPNFLGGNGWSLTPKAIFAFDWSRFGFALNAAYRVALLGRRFDLGFGETLFADDEFQGGVGVKVVAVKKLLDVIADAQFAFGIKSQDSLNRFGELWGAARFHLKHNLHVDVGLGPGLTHGAGVPSVRAFASLAYLYDKRDTDKDGIWDDVDKCPNDPEDKDGFEDADGCPDPDNDKDGIPDVKDKCPNEPETFNGFEDEDGCPEKDTDKDGIYDSVDKCPNDPEDKDGFEDEDGCPDPDNDKDGIPDVTDKCPNEPEDKDGFEDEDGCPDPDNDKDGIPDVKDKCPNDPETFNKFEDEDGCPDTIPAKLKKFDGVVKGIEFDYNKATIRPSSFTVLDEAVSVMKEYDDLKMLIRGHTDNVGGEAFNKKLSLDRAESVKAYLVGKGIAPERLSTEGLWFSESIADNKTSAGRAKNRRIEFRRVSQ